MIHGGCFCGVVRYEIDDGSYPVANCHCSMCRRTSGAPFVTWLVVPAARFRYVQGTPRSLRSSTKGTRWFCERCGTPLVCITADHPDNVDVTTGSLDQPEGFVPTIAVHEDTKLPWLETTERVAGP
ncbi:MAG: GFA family protein [Pseudomonadales bacterium]